MPTVGHPLRLLAIRMATWECDSLVACPPECGVSRICTRQIQFYTDELMALSATLTAERDEAMRLAADIDKDRGRLAERTKELDEKLAPIAVLAELIARAALATQQEEGK